MTQNRHGSAPQERRPQQKHSDALVAGDKGFGKMTFRTGGGSCERAFWDSSQITISCNAGTKESLSKPRCFDRLL